jgi:hypothetical protein
MDHSESVEEHPPPAVFVFGHDQVSGFSAFGTGILWQICLDTVCLSLIYNGSLKLIVGKPEDGEVAERE